SATATATAGAFRVSESPVAHRTNSTMTTDDDGHAWAIRQGASWTYVEHFECTACHTWGYVLSKGGRPLALYQFRTRLRPRWFRGRRTLIGNCYDGRGAAKKE